MQGFEWPLGGGGSGAEAKFTVLFCCETKSFRGSTDKLPHPKPAHEQLTDEGPEPEGVGECFQFSQRGECASDPRMQSIQHGFDSFGDFQIGCVGFCVAPPETLKAPPVSPPPAGAAAAEDWPKSPARERSAETDRMTMTFKHMVVGWVLLDRHRRSKIDGKLESIGYRFLRPPQAANFKDRDTKTRRTYKDACIILDDEENVRQHILTPFMKMTLLMQHQFKLAHPPEHQG